MSTLYEKLINKLNLGNETKLLVVDEETEKYYRNKGIAIRGDLLNVSIMMSSEGNGPLPSCNNHLVNNNHL